MTADDGLGYVVTYWRKPKKGSPNIWLSRSLSRRPDGAPMTPDRWVSLTPVGRDVYRHRKPSRYSGTINKNWWWA